MDNERLRKAVVYCLTPFIGGSQKSEDITGFSGEDWEELYQFAVLHNIEPVLYEGLPEDKKAELPAKLRGAFEEASLDKAMHFYGMLNFTDQIIRLMQENGIAGVVLKGILLSGLYPKEELRYFGDVDFFIPDQEQYRKACSLLESLGFSLKEMDKEWHYAYSGLEKYTQKKCYLELHARIADDVFGEERPNTADRIFADIAGNTEETEVMGYRAAGFQVTENAAYLLLHMAKHFRRGIGLRQYLDWIFFLQKEGSRIDRERFLGYLKELGILRFSVTATYAAVRYFGLSRAEYNLLFQEQELPDKNMVHSFINDVFTAGEFGRAEKTRITRRHWKESGFGRYFKELQEQTSMLYPKQSKRSLLRPLLWILTVCRFIKVIVFERKMNLADTFRTYHRRESLQHYLNLFHTECDKMTGERK